MATEMLTETFKPIENTSLVDKVESNLVQLLFYRNGRFVD